MSSEDFLDKLAQAIADGESIDWGEVEKELAGNDELGSLLKLFRDVAAVEEVHRSLGDEIPASGDSTGSRPAVEPPSPDTPLHAPTTAALGQWGHLLILRKIGEGTFGEVYHAHDTGLDRPVALKLFKPKVASRDTATRILHEARKLARIRHPNIVSVHGAASYDGRVGFWMDLIDGATLEKLVSAGRMSGGEAANIGADVCRALAAVHQAEIIHRDIKAENVMRAADDGRIVLTDFGAGEFIAEMSSSSRGQGTPLYIAPELFLGQAASVQSDIYATGVLLYYLVTGSFPVRGSSIGDLMAAHERGDRRRLRDRRPDLPHAFVSVVERAIDPDPARRFTSAGEMEAALAGGSMLSAQPVAMPQPPPTLLETIGIGRLLTAAALVTLLLGVLACRVFEVALGVDPDFSALPYQYLQVGLQGLFPFLVYWLGAAALVATAAALQPLVRAPVAAIRMKWDLSLAAVEPEVAAAFIFLAGVASWVTITLVCWTLFEALEGLRTGSAMSASELLVLGSSGRPLQLRHSGYSAILSFVLGLAIVKWFPRLEKVAREPGRVRLFKWATVAIGFLVIASAVVPRRLIYESYEVVAYDNQRAFVIGTTTEEMLLYSRVGRDPKRWRVRKDDPNLQRTGTIARIFDPQ